MARSSHRQLNRGSVVGTEKAVDMLAGFGEGFEQGWVAAQLWRRRVSDLESKETWNGKLAHLMQPE